MITQYAWTVIGTAGASAAYDGGGSFYIRPNTDKTLLEVTNSSGVAVTLNIFLQLFEI